MEVQKTTTYLEGLEGQGLNCTVCPALPQAAVAAVVLPWDKMWGKVVGIEESTATEKWGRVKNESLLGWLY